MATTRHTTPDTPADRDERESDDMPCYYEDEDGDLVYGIPPQSYPDPTGTAYHEGHEMQSLIDAARPEMFNELAASRGYLDEETLGVLIARWASWDCRRVFEVCRAALEDANMHTEAGALTDSAQSMLVLED